MTYNERLAAAGIETVRSGHNDAFGRIVYLRYNGKQIRRPRHSITAVRLFLKIVTSTPGHLSK